MPVLTGAQVKRLSHLDGKFRRNEGVRLANLAAQVQPNHAIVEVGSFRGKSTCYLALGAQAGHGAHIYAVDLWTIGGQLNKHGKPWPAKQQYEAQETYDIFCAQLRRMGVDGHVTPIRSASGMAACQWQYPIGLLHIDAEHSYQACLADIDAWSQHIVPNGWIALHDYSEHFPGVVQAAQERIVNSAAWSDMRIDGTLLTARKVG